MATRLIDLHADVNEIDSEIMTPLHWALIRGRRKTFRLLMESPKIKPNKGSDGHDKPIHICIDDSFKDLQMFQTFLRDDRVAVNAEGSQGKTAQVMIVENIATLEPLLDTLLGREVLDV